jgi:hypothetical protein
MAGLLLPAKGNQKWHIFHSMFSENMAPGPTVEY